VEHAGGDQTPRVADVTRRRPRHLLSTLAVSYFGCGLFPVAPGTVGTAGAAVTAWLLLAYVPAATTDWWAVALAATLVASAVTVLLTPDLERRTGKDPQVVVTDEVAGYFVTLAAVPSPGLPHLVAAFFLFRLLDVVKPWPANRLEKLPEGWGVLLDDVMAGAYGAAILALIARI